MQTTPQRLHNAWRKVRRGSRSPGIDGITVEMFDPVAAEQLDKLERQLTDDTYSPRPAKGFYLKKTGGGRRLIGISTIRDRIVQGNVLSGVLPCVV